MQAEPDVTTQFSSLLSWVLLFLFADGAKDVLGGAITGSGKQAVTNPILFVSYWVLGLPLGALAAFKWPGNNLKGSWWGNYDLASFSIVPIDLLWGMTRRLCN